MNNSLNTTAQRKIREREVLRAGAKVEAEGMKMSLVSYLMKRPWTFGNHFLVDS